MDIKIILQENIDFSQELLVTGLSALQNDVNELNHICQNYAAIGYFNYLSDDDPYRLSTYFYKYGRAYLLLNKLRSGEVAIQAEYPLKKPAVRVDLMDTCYPFLILSNSKSLLLECCNSIYIERQDTIEYALTHAFKYMMLGQKNNFQIHFKSALSKLNYKTPLQQKGHLYLLEGLQNKDTPLFNEGLSLVLKAFRKNKSEGFMRNFISYEATAYAKLAIDFGMSIAISDKLINKKLLQPIKVDYEDINEVYQALKMTPSW
ncbi:hypothetical protein [Runella sp.]|uniref:hypothetical protein n=1 Tax=Runella sp. TaxID=1960881 RepID=UPI003D13763F